MRVVDEQATQSLDSNEFGSNTAAITKKDVLRWHLNANAIGDYYDIKPLCTLSRSKVKGVVEAKWSPHDFLRLLTEACTTRKTGDIELHRLLGQIISNHLDELSGLQDLGSLDLPADTATSVIVSSIERIRSLEKTIRYQADSIDSLELGKKALEAQVSNAHKAHETLLNTSACRSIYCNERFSCSIEQHGITYRLCCSRCCYRH